MPGSLDVADLDRLCPADQHIFAWAEQHLRALTQIGVPTLVPARQANGHCHWLYEGRCAVHDHSPYGCAFFDSHMPHAEVKQRSVATAQARKADAEQNGPYYQIWLHLCRKGLIDPSGDRTAVAEERRRIRQSLPSGGVP
jgi:hypothetical protein